MHRNRLLLAVSAALLALAAHPSAAAEPAAEPQGPEQFAGVLANIMNGRTVPIVVHIDSYSPAGDVRALALLLKDKGQDAVENALFRMKGRGWIRIGSSLGYEVPIIRSLPTPTGRRIVVIADRPIQFWEQWRGTRSLQYPFGMVVLDLDRTGHGEGRLIAAMRAKFDNEGKVELESFGTEPFRIVGLAQQSLN
jgi:hypothetical protein